MTLIARLTTFGIMAASIVAAAAVVMALIEPPKAVYLTVSGAAALAIGISLPVFTITHEERTNARLWIQTLLLISTGCLGILCGLSYSR